MTSQTLVALAKKQIGTKESPPSSNHVKYNTAYYGSSVSGKRYPWCCVFVWWLFRKGKATALFYGGEKTASCGALARYAKQHGQYVTKDYKPGDLVFFHFGKGTIVHIGIVESVRSSGTLITIEGNTGTTNDANGGAVMRRVRKISLVAGAYRPDYDGEEDDDVKRYRLLQDIPQGFQSAIKLLMDAGILQGTETDLETKSPVLDLTHEQVRTLILVYRGGGFDAKLMQEGLPPAVNTNGSIDA